MQVRKQQLELDMEQQTGSKWEKEYVKAVYCHPAEYIMRNAGLEEAQAGIKEQWMLGFAGLGHSKYQGHSTQFSPLHGI